jgi:hypothetical protein
MRDKILAAVAAVLPACWSGSSSGPSPGSEPDGAAGSGGADAATSDAAAGADAASPGDPDAGPPARLPTWWCGELQPSSDVLLDLGHATTVDVLQQEGDRILSRDTSGHWLLSDAATRDFIVSGQSQLTCSYDPSCPFYPIELAGSTLLVAGPTSLEVRGSSAGQVLATIPWTPARAGLAVDGSYVWIASTSALAAYSTTGALLFSRAGNYSAARVFAAPGEVRVGAGPAGASVIELVATSDGSATVTPAFAGTFASWFLDGERFITTVSTTATRVYAKDAQLVKFLALDGSRVVGQGEHLSRQGPGSIVRVWQIAAGTYTDYPLVSGGRLARRGTLLAILHRENVRVLDLQGATAVETFTTFAEPLPWLTAFAIEPGGQWSFAQTGMVFASANVEGPDGTLPTTCGQVYAQGYPPVYDTWYETDSGIAGSRAGQVAVSLHEGQKTLYFDLGSGTPVLTGIIPLGLQLPRLSDDGSMLVGEATGVDPSSGCWSLLAMSAPEGTRFGMWTCNTNSGSYPVRYSLADSGSRLGVGWDTGWSVLDMPSGTSIFYTAEGYTGVRLSPSGRRWALMRSLSDGFMSSFVVYDDGTLVGAAEGVAVGWIDEDRLLVQTFDWDQYAGMAIVDTTGAIVATPDLPIVHRFARVDADRIYVPQYDAIYSLTDGTAVWTSAVANPLAYRQSEALAGDGVVTKVGHLLYFETYGP